MTAVSPAGLQYILTGSGGLRHRILVLIFAKPGGRHICCAIPTDTSDRIPFHDQPASSGTLPEKFACDGVLIGGQYIPTPHRLWIDLQ